MLLICPNTTLLRSDNPRLRGFHFLCLLGFKAQGRKRQKPSGLGWSLLECTMRFFAKKNS